MCTTQFSSKNHFDYQNLEKKVFLESYFKNTFSPNSSNQKVFFKKIGWYTFFFLYMWAKYEPIWLNITAQTVTLDSNLLWPKPNLLWPKPYLKTPIGCFLFDQKLRLLKIFEF